MLSVIKAQRAEFIDLHTAAKAYGREGTLHTPGQVYCGWQGGKQSTFHTWH